MRRSRSSRTEAARQRGRESARGLGADARVAMKDAILRSVRVAGETGVRALLAHAISPAAKAFYLKNGFRESPVEPMTVMLNVAALARG